MTKPTNQQITVEQSGAFVETFSLAATSRGPLDGLRFAVKDLIDVAGHNTGCGNPSWRDTHPRAELHAVCVEQVLAAGGECVGKTITDEMAFSLIGENHFYGTPLNPAAPDRVPGGSSSGSASAVACGLADFALGSDTGGSVRVPASNCGLWGLRPSHGAISVAGVMPFAPSFDTIGFFANDSEILERVGSVLLARDPISEPTQPTIHLLDEAFSLIDSEVRVALDPVLDELRVLFPGRLRKASLDAWCGVAAGGGLEPWVDSFYTLQFAEIQSSLSAWIADARPTFGPATAASFELARSLDRRTIGAAARRREAYDHCLAAAMGPGDLLCIPTVPAPAPLKATNAQNRKGHYYRRALSLTSIAGLARLPQVSLPLAVTAASPVGLSLIAARGQDMHLLATVRKIAAALVSSRSG